MSYARHIGRVGALAVTLGVGAAIANAPGIAYADSTGTSPSGGDTEQKTEAPKNETPSTTNTVTTEGADSGKSDPSTSDRRSQRRSVLRSVVSAIRDIADDAVAAGNAAGATSRLDKQDPVGSGSTARKSLDTSTYVGRHRAETKSLADMSENVESTVKSVAEHVEQAVQKFTAPTLASTQNGTSTPAPQAFTTTTLVQQQPAPQPRTSVIPLITNPLGALLQPILYPGNGTPTPQLPTLMAIVIAVRDEVERILVPRQTQVDYPIGTPQTYPNPPVDPTKQHVLVVAIDGTNLSKVLEDPENENFVELMGTSTNSEPSIVGHTTVSNPSWTAILTGAWDNKTGVINNVFTPTTYDRWPTVFTQLENYDSDIRTKQIGDWDVIGAISASGTGADEVVYIPQVADDPIWGKTDKAVTDATVSTLKGPNGNYTGDAPNFMVSYLVQDDENGHMFGGDSIQYKEALQRTDNNLGDILDAVAAREAATGEDWTVIVVTDHGHQPQQGFGHGFQSPRETATFVIVDGPQFGDSRFNPNYSIVDTTPTVLALFGAPQPTNLDGVPLQSLHGSDSAQLTQAELQEVLAAQFASSDFPNIFVNTALSLRTIVAFLPYIVHGQDLPAPLGDILWVATNVPAQVVAWATGIQGASLLPILPPPPAITFIPDQANSIGTMLSQDCSGLAAAQCVAV
jgi:hypothetical protein